jgi:hypothetical protein
MRVKKEGGLADGDEVFEEAFRGIDEGGVGEGIKGAAETNFVAC